jgi:signal-transduction protein with cAMP-binding, CBS, and nucleotidyltransferase domain
MIIVKLDRFTYLEQKYPYKEWPKYKLHDLNEKIQEVRYLEGSIVYDFNHPTSTFYIVMSGNLTMETFIEVDSYYKIPVGKSQWQL